ncbi:piggyBac transposable element-derived protein 4-like [Maniola hyperantus]|uniref:piggyBac transposable element-derived protein 4-like n=1 Tax=Aphantopus hyperantus TaxID=2795564 RepID=UPI003747C817
MDSARPQRFLFLGEPGIKTNFTSSASALADLFFSNEFLGSMVQATNNYAHRMAGPLQKHARLRQWTDTTITEMRKFVGMLLYMGLTKLPTIAHYWMLDPLYNLPLFRQIMSRKRFQLLLRYLHFSENDDASTSRLHKIQPILDRFNNIMADLYYPEANLSIDESMVLWRGRLVFRQYIKNKKHKYGVKLYELCESSGIVMKIRVYKGKSERPPPGVLHSTEVILDLMEGYLEKGHTIYADNFYNSPDLTRRLSERKTYICGTLRKMRKNLPKDVTNAKLKRGKLAAKSCNDITVCKWKDKRDVLVISNKHQLQLVNVRNRNGKVSLKPNIVADYNIGMSGVDRGDQMVSYYSCLRKTLRWQKKLALHIFEVYVQNAHRLLRLKDRTSKIRLLKFREDFIKYLLGLNCGDTTPTAAEAPGPQIPPVQPGPAQVQADSSPFLPGPSVPPASPAVRKSRVPLRDFHFLEKLSPTKKAVPAKPCRVCTKNKKRKESSFVCATCPEKPALCVVNCFYTYHTDPRFV